MNNIWSQFEKLIAPAPLLIGTVAAIRADGLVSITLPDGSAITARGSGTVGNAVYVQDGVIQGNAPTMPVDVVTLY